MDTQRQIQKLMKARQRLERKVKDIDTKIEHIIFRMNEERRCFSRNCPLDAQPCETDGDGTPPYED